MAEFAVADERVKLRIFEEKRQAAAEDFDGADPDAWKKQLQYEKKSMELKNNLHNLMLILENDENLKGIVFNQLEDGMEIREKVPWPHSAKFWRDADDAQLICYVDAAYGTFSAKNYDIAVTKAVDDRSYFTDQNPSVLFRRRPPRFPSAGRCCGKCRGVWRPPWRK